MNITKSVLNISGFVIRSLKLPVNSLGLRSLSTQKILSSKEIEQFLSTKQLFSSLQCSCRQFHSSISFDQNENNSSSKLSLRPTASLVMKKRPARKKRLDEQAIDGRFNVFAYATAEEYDLESLHTALTKQDLYGTRKFYIESGEDVLHVRSKYNVEPEPRDIFFFRVGSVVLWNCSEPEVKTILRNLKQFEISPYNDKMVKEENEIMNYAYTESGSGSFKNETFCIQQSEEGDLEKYTFSNAMTSSVKLGIWESMLDNYIDGLANVTGDLRDGRRIRMTRACILRKTGELFALKHLINLDSDLLETPDFYWDREKLEQLFNKTCHYFSIQKRKRVIITDFARSFH